jgi:hypothetical protein
MEELPHNGIEWTLLRNGGYNRDIKNPARFEPIIRVTYYIEIHFFLLFCLFVCFVRGKSSRSLS